MKYNLNQTNNELRVEICTLQKDAANIRECNAALKDAMSDDTLAGFGIALIAVFIFLAGYIVGSIFD